MSALLLLSFARSRISTWLILGTVVAKSMLLPENRNVSVPAPAFTESAASKMTKSSPAPASMVSAPAPPSMVSLPAPVEMLFAPELPTTESAPEPVLTPSMSTKVSLPNRFESSTDVPFARFTVRLPVEVTKPVALGICDRSATSMAAPAPPVIVSLPAPPSKVSAALSLPLMASPTFTVFATITERLPVL